MLYNDCQKIVQSHCAHNQFENISNQDFYSVEFYLRKNKKGNQGVCYFNVKMAQNMKTIQA